MAKISVIMPVCNRDWIVSKAIKSILNQTFNDFELIIVNDGSTDKTQEMISLITDQRIKSIDLDKNTGASHARNTGLKVAKGERIAYLDSDNIWYPNFLEVMDSELKDPYVMVYSGQNVHLLDGDKAKPKIIGRKIRSYPYNSDMLMKENFIDTSCVLHKREIIETVGFFDETLATLEDWDFFARIAVRYPFAIKHVEEVLGEYHYFLKGTAATIENSRISDKEVLAYFDIPTMQGDQKKIIDKLDKLIHRPKV